MNLLSSIKGFELFIIFVALFVMVFFILVAWVNFSNITSENHRRKKKWSISVIIPVYNEEENLEKCIESVERNGYPKKLIEIIVVDDGSTDKSLEIAKKLAKKYKNIKVLSKNNTGKADSLNFGLSYTTKELTAVLDADTFLEKGALEKLASHFEQGADAVTPVAKVANANKNILTRLQQVEYLFTAFIRKVLQEIESIYVTPGTLSMFRTSILKGVGGFDVNNILEDQEIAMRLQSKNYKIHACLEAVVYTIVPETFSSLLKQRERWHRGGLRNAFKYMHLINPKYGDFGVLIMPLSIISIVLMFSLLGIVVFQRVVVQHVALGSMLLLDPTFVLGTIMFIITLFWTHLNLKVYDDNISAVDVLLYLITYAYFITFVWIVSLTKEAMNAKLEW